MGVADIDEKATKKEFEEVNELDSGKQNNNIQEDTYKQNVTRCVQMSDYAINNLKERSDAEDFLHRKLLRFVSLVLSPGSSKPRKEEVYMNMAYALAVKSNCICRQVGTVITGEDEYVVGAGWNDVACGEVSCGLRPLCDLNTVLHKHVRDQLKNNGKTRIESDYKKRIVKGNKQYPLYQACFCFKAEKAPKNNQHQLEYCVALHAEENALIQGSRIGGPGVRGGTIYTTAQPCTLCAKKIKQTGICKVVYIDPYPKSEPDIFMSNVELIQFEGVKPRAYITLFMHNIDQKEWQELEVCNTLPGFDFNKKSYLF